MAISALNFKLEVGIISTHCAAGKCDAEGDVAFIIPILWWTYLKILKRCPSQHDVMFPSEHGTN